ncbi:MULTISPECIES: hypothetical protein [unclassified Streptomyces]|uniref:hypothetical protein n=1 Tax=unclassified Streptomyces TaxID=2593676 RepID=UPI000DB9D4D9|nr:MULTISPECIES: hypothetical protein [unclassified Streptomyces]MYT75209.1 hypothetical protein [Streptomyces sp. SID8367]RAJ77165.1 hypothetical protein K377_05923 [Streptomyces sp. PsTaAH-137]
MTVVHRPLTSWVRAAVSTSGGGWTPVGPLNEGDERTDARSLPRFASGWQRVALPLDGDGHALALSEPATGSAVFELDDLGQPLPAGPEVARTVAALERRWPADRWEPAEAEELRAADPGLRFSLLDRMTAEGRPVPECFHILPWERVDRLAARVRAAIEGAGDHPAPGGTEAAGTVRLRHYFSPAGSRFTAALEQLDAALHAGDTEVRRVATTTLCTRLAGAATGRIPERTRERLTELLGAVGRADPFLSSTSELAVDRLARAAPEPLDADGPPGTASRTGGVVWGALRYGEPASLRSWFAPAAADEPQRIRETVARETFTLTLTLASDNSMYVAAATPRDDTYDRLLSDGYGDVLLLPVRITGATEATDAYVLLRAGSRGRAGALVLTVAEGAPDVVTADQSGPPLGRADVPSLDPAVVRATQACLARSSDRTAWLDLVADLTAGHPVRRAVEDAVDGEGE